MYSQILQFSYNKIHVRVLEYNFTGKNTVYSRISLSLVLRLNSCRSIRGLWSRTIRKTDRKTVETFETRCWRTMLKMTWTERVTNCEYAYSKIKQRRSPWTAISGRRKKWILLTK